MKGPLPLELIARQEVARNTADLHAWNERIATSTRPEFIKYARWMAAHCAKQIEEYQAILDRAAVFHAMNFERRLSGIEAEPVLSETGAIVRPLVQRVAAA